MRSRLYILLFVLFVVSVTLWFLMDRESEDPMTDRDFAIEQRSEIHKVVLTKRSGNSLVLEKKDGDWWVNGEREARVNAIDNLLNGLTHVEIQSLPALSQYETLKKDFVRFSIKVEVYDEDGNILRTYYIGPDSNDGEGTYYLMEGGDRFYLMSMPAFTGGMRARFDLAEQDWWKRRIFEYDPAQIESVKVHYPRQPQSSFILKREEEGFSVDPLTDRPRITRPFLHQRATSYLQEYQKKGILEFANQYEGRDSVLSLTPFSEIQVITQKDTSGYIFIPRTDQEMDGPDSRSPQTTFQYTYWLFEPESSDLMTVQHYQFKPIFRGYDYFFAD